MPSRHSTINLSPWHAAICSPVLPWEFVELRSIPKSRSLRTSSIFPDAKSKEYPLLSTLKKYLNLCPTISFTYQHTNTIFPLHHPATNLLHVPTIIQWCLLYVFSLLLIAQLLRIYLWHEDQLHVVLTNTVYRYSRHFRTYNVCWCKRHRMLGLRTVYVVSLQLSGWEHSFFSVFATVL